MTCLTLSSESGLFISLSFLKLDSLSDDDQMASLAALYFNLLGMQPSSRFGEHWQDIGFQGYIRVSFQPDLELI